MRTLIGFALGFALMFAWHKQGGAVTAWLFSRGAPDGGGLLPKRPSLEQYEWSVRSTLEGHHG